MYYLTLIITVYTTFVKGFYDIKIYKIIVYTGGFFVTISQRIFSLMSERSISKSDLAKGTGIKPNTISDWQTKGTNPSADKIACICDFLNVSANWLLTGEDKPPSNSIAGDVNGSAFIQGVNRGNVTVHNGHERPLSDEAAELLKLYEGLPLKKRVKLLQAAIELSESED